MLTWAAHELYYYFILDIINNYMNITIDYLWLYICLQVNVYKDPITDAGKKSKKGQMTLEIHDDKFETKTEGSGDPKNVS